MSHFWHEKLKNSYWAFFFFFFFASVSKKFSQKYINKIQDEQFVADSQLGVLDFKNLNEYKRRNRHAVFSGRFNSYFSSF